MDPRSALRLCMHFVSSGSLPATNTIRAESLRWRGKRLTERIRDDRLVPKSISPPYEARNCFFRLAFCSFSPFFLLLFSILVRLMANSMCAMRKRLTCVQHVVADVVIVVVVAVCNTRTWRIWPNLCRGNRMCFCKYFKTNKYTCARFHGSTVFGAHIQRTYYMARPTWVSGIRKA